MNIRIETVEDPNNKDFARFFIKLNTVEEFQQLLKYLKIMKKCGIKIKQEDYEITDCNEKFYLDCMKKNLKKFMKNSFSDRICRNCNNRGKNKKMKVCSNCKISWYCSKECQNLYWENHKKFCKYMCVCKKIT